MLDMFYIFKIVTLKNDFMEEFSLIADLIFGIIYFFVGILLTASMWQIYTKFGEKGWTVLIPIYNTIVLLRIADKKWFPSIFLLLIPIVNLYYLFDIYRTIAGKLGKDSDGFALGMLILPFIFFPLLAFGNNK